MPTHGDFGFQRSTRSEQPDQDVPDQSAKIAHRSNYRPIRRGQSGAWVFGVDSPPVRCLAIRREFDAESRPIDRNVVAHSPSPTLRKFDGVSGYEDAVPWKAREVVRRE